MAAASAGGRAGGGSGGGAARMGGALFVNGGTWSSLVLAFAGHQAIGGGSAQG